MLRLLLQNAATPTSTMSGPLSISLATALCGSLLLVVLVSLFQCLCRNRHRLRRCDGSETTPSSQVGHTIPVIIYRCASASTQPPPQPPPSESSCSICLSDFEDGAEIRALTRCNHAFHKGCIDQWLPSRSSSCPVCRDPVVECRVEPTRSTNCQTNLHFLMAAQPAPHLPVNL